MNVLHHKIGKIPREDAGEIACWITDRVEDDTVEKLKSVGQTQLQCAFDNGANERLETGIRVRDLQSVTGANDADGQHSGGVDEFKRSIDRIAADKLLFWVVLLPLHCEIKGKVF